MKAVCYSVEQIAIHKKKKKPESIFGYFVRLGTGG